MREIVQMFGCHYHSAAAMTLVRWSTYLPHPSAPSKVKSIWYQILCIHHSACDFRFALCLSFLRVERRCPGPCSRVNKWFGCFASALWLAINNFRWMAPSLRGRSRTHVSYSINLEKWENDEKHKNHSFIRVKIAIIAIRTPRNI